MFLSQFVEQPFHLLYLINFKSSSIIAGWGLKPSSIRARRYAKKNGLPYLSLEDGFIRSLDLGVNSARQHSLILDYSGIYYNAPITSDLEICILKANTVNVNEIQRSHQCIKSLKKKKLSKYNLAPFKQLTLSGRVKVLVIDQTFGDSSIEYGMASAYSFNEMLEAAITRNPTAEILVKIHPDVLAGKKQGHLLESALTHNCTVIAEDINPWSLLEIVDHVYVVTSQMGFEALMAGKKVTCFGMPFYAGWGLTDDKLHCERRNVKRSLEQVFYAAYIQYTRYINPYTGIRCELEDTIKLISHQKHHLEKFRGKWLVFGFYNWKKKFIPDFLGLGADIVFTLKLNNHIDSLSKDDNFLIWSNKISQVIIAKCAIHNVRLWRMEDGFLRSVGLGGDLIRPLSLVIDSCGIYYDATTPNDLENLLNYHDFDEELINRSAFIRKRLIELKLTKYNVGRQISLDLPSDKKIILVPGQVETDASIKFGSPIVKTNLQLLQTVRHDNPAAYIIYKPHPDVLTGGRLGELQNTRPPLFDLLITESSITDLFEVIDELHTMSSLSGFEALLRHKKVCTYGMPFYAGWGLTTDKLICDRRKRLLTLDQLVAATLILYPIYVDPDSGDVCDVETAIHILQQQKQLSQRLSFKTRLYRIYRKVFEKKR